jgi:hypothetical protein
MAFFGHRQRSGLHALILEPAYLHFPRRREKAARIKIGSFFSENLRIDQAALTGGIESPGGAF